jgi:hypothetical protein
MLVELVLVLPILVILLTAMIEFGLLLVARQELLAASREGARAASHGAPNDEVRAVVYRCLGEGRLGHANVSIAHFDEDLFLPNAPRDRVQVVVHVRAGHVVPDFLGLIGLSVGDEVLAGGTIMCMETLSPQKRYRHRGADLDCSDCDEDGNPLVSRYGVGDLNRP